MAYTHTAADARELAFAPASVPTKTTRKAGLFSRLFTAMMAARQRQAEREVARYLGDLGGKFTDETEREIERRFLATPSRW